jgi:hypothetical protein
MVHPIDPAELATVAAQLAATSYHELLHAAVHARMAMLLADDVTDPYVAMKRRGQVEELQRVLLPSFLQSLAVAGLVARAAMDARAAAPPSTEPPPPPRGWWVDPVSEGPVP